MNIPKRDFPESHIEDLRAKGYSDSEIEIIALHAGLIAHRTDNRTEFAKEVANRIIEFINSDCNLSLTYSGWDSNYIIARDGKGKRYVIVGSFGAVSTSEGYLLRGVVREKVKGRAFTWLTNGQAGKNAIEVKHYAEEAAVPFPEFKKNASDYYAVMNKPRRLS